MMNVAEVIALSAFGAFVGVLVVLCSRRPWPDGQRSATGGSRGWAAIVAMNVAGSSACAQGLTPGSESKAAGDALRCRSSVPSRQ